MMEEMGMEDMAMGKMPKGMSKMMAKKDKEHKERKLKNKLVKLAGEEIYEYDDVKLSEIKPDMILDKLEDLAKFIDTPFIKKQLTAGEHKKIHNGVVDIYTTLHMVKDKGNSMLSTKI